jgi:hypothetical protein
MEITGKIETISETFQVTDSFRKRTFSIECLDNPKYPQYIELELVQDKCSLMDSMEIGTDIRIEFNLNGRKWTNPDGLVKYFNTLQAWKIEPLTTNTDGLPF